MTSHTQGPWTTEAPCKLSSDLSLRLFAGDRPIGSMNEHEDAILAAAAPSLLAACQEIATYPTNVDGYNSANARALRMVAMQSIARTAIARATGKE